MALIQVNYVSKALMRTVPLNVILPVDKISFATMDYENRQGKKFKTLYLLHGIFGNYTDWVSGTRIQRWAEEKGLCVVMPSGDNAFYVNSITPMNDYGKFIGEEIVEVTRRMFPLSTKRKDTFIAGLSMGGFGAMRNGLKYSDTFGYIASLSGALQLFEGEKSFLGDNMVFGDIKKAKNSDINPEYVMKKLVKEGKEKPVIYIACGTSDSLLASNRKFRDKLIKNGFDVTYVEEPGAHEWDFWDRQIKAVIDWLPLGKNNNGLNSGNIGK